MVVSRSVGCLGVSVHVLTLAVAAPSTQLVDASEVVRAIVLDSATHRLLNDFVHPWGSGIGRHHNFGGRTHANRSEGKFWTP